MKTDDFEKEKAIWKNAEKHEQKLIPDVSNFDSLCRNSFTTVISHIKRNFIIECFAVVCSLGFLWVVSFTYIKETHFTVLVSCFTIAGLALAYYFYRKIYSIKTIESFDRKVNETLHDTLVQIDRSVKEYKTAQKIFGYIFLPLICFVGYRYMFISYSSINSITLSQYLFTWRSILFLGSCILFLSFYAKLIEILINRIYKKHIDSLKEIIDEIAYDC